MEDKILQELEQIRELLETIAGAIGIFICQEKKEKEDTDPKIPTKYLERYLTNR